MNHPKPHSSAHSSVDVTETEYSSAKYVFEASFAQKRLWLVDQLLSDKSVYNIPAAIRLKGSIQYEALEQTFRAIIHRHDTLRTTFKENDGDIVQIVEESILWRLSIEDLASLPEDVRWERAVGLAELEATAPFDLETGPLFRIRLIRIGESDHLLLVNLHHIISDGWSTGILMQELSLLYKAFSNGKKIELPELPVQYADFAYFQKEWMQGEAFEANLSFWKEKLSGELPVLELYTAYPRSAKSGDGGRTFKFTVNSAVSRAIKELSRREGATSFMTLLALYKVWLYRYSNQTDLLVGTPVAGRDSEEVEGLIGFLVNNLVIRSHLSAADSFRNLLRQVKSTVVEAYRYQEVPFEKVVEVVQPVRDAGATPIFQTMFVFQQQDISFELEGLQSERVELERGTSKFDLLLELTESEEGFSGVLEYSTDLFIPGTVEQMAAHFTRLLESAAANPEERVGRLAMLNEAEVHQQTVEWNRTEQRLPNWSLQERFEEQAARTPERTALVWGTAELTYGELNRQANRLAHRLQSLGVGPDKLVGVCLERSPELVIGMLAVIKAGGAYVPVDPALPQERRRDMMKRAGLKVLVTRQAFTEGVDSDTGMTVVCVDADQAILEAEREGNPQAQASADNLMYVIYTSGSTGLPKGASVYRRGFANLMQWYIGE
ncbi:condensation domain-containing protein, partial [Paenibacillus sp. GCM10012307]